MPALQDSLRCPGMRDLSGDEMDRLRSVEDAFAAVCGRWTFEQIRTPLIEYMHLYTMSGALSPQLLGRVYSFLDWDGWSGERVVLRPDSTVAVARVYGERYAPTPARLFYLQNVLRFAPAPEQREEWQAGAEIIGQPVGSADVELIILALEVFSQLSLPRPQAVISHPGLVRALLAATGWPVQQQVATYDSVLDGDLDAVTRIGEALPAAVRPGLDLMFSVEGRDEAYLDNIEATFAGQVAAMDTPLSELRTMAALLSRLGVEYTVSNALVRDFEYYTGPVFHLRHNGRLLGGGGRYDQLIEGVTGSAAPACGFALDTEAVAGLLDAQQHRVSSVAVLTGGDGSYKRAFELVGELHARGLRACVNPTSPNGLAVTVAGDGYLIDGGGPLTLEVVLEQLVEKAGTTE